MKKIQFKDAKDLWGKGSHETESILAEKYGHDYSILSIGPAGENLVVMPASIPIITDRPAEAASAP
jgi:aldehyde:ferredoxin oxidoreductase